MSNVPPRLLMKTTCFLLLLAAFTPARGGDLTKDYFTATKPGAWSEYILTAPDGTKSTYSYERRADDAGHPVVELIVKVLAGPGKDTKVKSTCILPKDFAFDRQGLNYGRFSEKVTMSYNGTEVDADAKTLAAIREGTKNFRGALTFEASEKIEGRMCDRYSYAMKIAGPNPTQESGRIWLDPAVPFAIARQTARELDAEGKVVSEFEMQLTGTGLNQALAVEPATGPGMKKVAPPPAGPVTLAEGFKTGRVGMELEVVPGSSGRRLSISLVNKTEADLAVTVPAGEMQLEVSTPVNTLKIAVAKSARLNLKSGQKSDAIVVEQKATRGVIEGRCSLSVYEGTPLYSGSVTIGSLPK